MSTAFDTRPATVYDVDALVSLVNSAYRGDSSRAGWTTEADLIGGIRIDEERLASSIAAEGNVILVHEREATLIACVHLQRKAEGCYLGMLTTEPTLQSAGVGRRMLHAAESWSIEHWNSRYMEMTVLAQRLELIAWYERRGYSRTGEQRPFPYGDHRWGLPTRSDLAFHVLRKVLPARRRRPGGPFRRR
jgi:ribosomal protein S18 acetylase RimI-like enzyme